ncbi:hypothetical protein ACIBFB_06970 [Nocardiopsis sp. NPDC050513]|uniref:hypothetical protein n=1 Tax=Nocardiopsis sp. NPDC050513 TaxID=3364338 RepID=UPI0037A302D2
MSSPVNLPLLVAPILYLLVGIGAVALGPLAPVGRKGLTVASGALILVSAIIDLVINLAWFPIHEFIGVPLGFDTATLVVNTVSYLSYALFGVGVILLVFAATRRRPKPAVGPATGVPRPPQTPYRPGPAAQR